MQQIIEFSAEWCGPCQKFAPEFEQIESEFSEKIDFVKYDVDRDVDEAYKYGIYSIPMVVFLKDGEEIGRLSGFREADELRERINELYTQ